MRNLLIRHNQQQIQKQNYQYWYSKSAAESRKARASTHCAILIPLFFEFRQWKEEQKNPFCERQDTYFCSWCYFSINDQTTHTWQGVISQVGNCTGCLSWANHRFKFRAIGASSSGLRSSFAVRTVGDWNQLPAVLVEQESPAAFNNQFDRLAPRISHAVTHHNRPLAWYSMRRSANYSSRQDKLITSLAQRPTDGN